MNAWVTGMTSALLISASWTDLRKLTIPNGLTVMFACIGLGYHMTLGGWPGALFSLAGAAAVMLPLLVLYRLRGMGGGDVKWFGAFGMWTGAVTALQLLLYSILFAGAISLFLLMLRIPGIRQWGGRLPWPWGSHPVLAGRKAAFPFMLAVAPAFVWLASFNGIKVF